MKNTMRAALTKGAVAVLATAGLALGGSAAAIASVGGAAPAPAGGSGHADSPHGRTLGSLIAGATTVGSTLSAVLPDRLAAKGAIVLAYQWSVDGVDVAGATGDSFDTVGLAPGALVGLTVTIGMPDGTIKTRTSQQILLGELTVAGAPLVTATGTEVGATLTVDPASAGWTPEPTSYVVVWFRDGDYLARGESYTSTAEDAGASITARVIAFLENYRPASSESAVVVLAAAVVEPAPAEPAPEEPVVTDPAATSDPGATEAEEKRKRGECDDDHDGWADGDYDRDGRVDANGAWWGGPAGWSGNDRGSNGGDRGDRGGNDRGGNDRGGDHRGGGRR